ncbi:hypothetical protein K2173_005166 [Erythroxylum novogranatense]|uniref:SAM-dependent MTase RsmB/NOP-type domain-containing protein n=1 Tax=Erythroxylum novogranatense TaxID=1862640 RepID=A0AAV8TUX5_9ROSI|nr:hypothetical protein K2173_005166 [Erythroxylum novogranatense]
MGGGRGHRSRTQRKHFRDGRENVWKRSKSDNSSSAVDNPPWQPFATQNPAFDEYYKEQGIVAIEEWDSFVQFLRTPLPSAFRINSSSQFSEDIKLQLENDFMKSLQAEDADGSEVEAIRPLPWYPDNLAWQSNFSRMQLRKNQTLEKFHEFLKLENEIGNITRQEAVSMVPPLFLDVRPDHFVLDMCAAPGSKTFQLLEIIYQSMESGSLPEGMVVANDLDVQRCNLLIHQTKRMCTANLIVTNNEAQHFPGCRANKTNFRASDREFEPQFSQLLFDRVLCDVPCSGDGTLRKAPDLWRKWNSGMGNGLHNLQVQIAMRGISLLKVGGRMVYSTCSMNPVENEAVVAEILRKCGGSVGLVDVSSSLPQLVRRPGLKKWKVRDKGVWLTSYKDVVKSHTSGVLPSMFPSGQSYEAPSDNNHKFDHGNCMNSEGSQMREDSVTNDVSEEVSDLPLEQCMRIVPHDQNSGSFFIAVLCKLSTLPVIPEKPPRHGQRFIKRDEAQEKPLDEVIEDSKGLELNSEDSAVENFSEAASEADMIQNDPNNSTLQPVPCNTCSENGPEEAQLPANEKTEAGKPGVKRKLQIQGRWKGVDPVIFFKDQDIIDSIKTFYGIDESFPFNGHLISRNSDNNHVKRLYYISKSVKDVLELNILAGQQLKISSVGLKMFERQTSREGNTAPCSFRISSEGLPVILPHIRKQILYSSAVDFKHLLQYKAVKFADFVDSEFGEKASKLQMGCCVIVLRDARDSTTPVKVDASTVAIGCWKGRGSLSVMVTAIDCQELLERLRLRTETENHSPMQENIFVEPDGMQNMDKIDELPESKVSEVAADG